MVKTRLGGWRWRRLLAVGVFLGAGVLLAVLGLVSTPGFAQAAATGLADTWQGTLNVGKGVRLVVKITQAGAGYKATFYSIDESGDGIPVSKTTLDGTTVTMAITPTDGKFEGKLSSDGKTMTGTWTQTQGAQAVPLNFVRATAETAWTIPPPTPKLAAMDPKATPSFEVATLKPSRPEEQGKAFLVRGNRFTTVNTTLSEMMSFAYGIHAKQVVGAPAWFDTEKFDLDAKPEGEGAPSDAQWKGMIQKLLVDRLQLKFHHDTRELSVYVLGVAKGGPKLTKSEGDPNGLPGLFFRGRPGDLGVRNATMGDFTGLLQNAVLDRPVLDKTGIAARWDFTLNWTPDDSQFGGMAAKIPPPADGAATAPGLYTAVQEQIGLKLEATKAATEVFVVDHIERPSEN